MDKKKNPMEPQDLDKEDINMGIEDINVEGMETISWLSLYIPPRKPIAKVTKDPDSLKFKVFMPLLPTKAPIVGDLLARVPFLKMEEWDSQ